MVVVLAFGRQIPQRETCKRVRELTLNPMVVGLSLTMSRDILKFYGLQKKGSCASRCLVRADR